ncbi:MAG: caspase family protein [Treponema sp.]|jgi:WD40 repeat protein|nr:caspase family protein [Treponema sp.]
MVIKSILRIICFCLFALAVLSGASAQAVVSVFPQLGHTATVNSVAFSADGSQAVSGSWDNTVKLWDIASGREIRTFSGHKDFVLSVAFSPNGKQVLSGSRDKTVKLWDAVSGKEIRTFSGHAGYIVYSAVFSADGKQILSGSNDNNMKLWDAVSGKEIRTFSGHSYIVYSVAFSPDGKQALSGSGDKTIKLWDTVSGKEIKTFPVNTEHGAWSVAFSPDGKYALSGFSSNIKLWDIASGREVKTFSGHTSKVNAVIFSPDGQQILSGSEDKTMKLWDVASGREIRAFSGSTDASMVFSSDGKYALFDFPANVNLKDWNAVSGRFRTFLGNKEIFIASSPDGAQVISYYKDNQTMKLWDTASGKEIKTFSASGPVVSAAFSPDGAQILSGSSDNSVKLWDIAGGRVIKEFPRHSYSSPINSVAFSPDGKKAISGASDRTVRLLDIESGEEITTFSGHNGAVLSVTFNPNGKQVLSGSGDGTIKLWDTASGREITTFSGHTGPVGSVKFSPDGRQILSGSYDNTVKLWETSKGREIVTFSGHTSPVGYVAFSSNENQALSCSIDGTVRLWDIITGREVIQFISFTACEWIVITPDGYFDASPDGDKYLNVRVGNSIYGMNQYRGTFYNSQVVSARLQDKPDPVRVTTTIQGAANSVPPVITIQSPADKSTLTAVSTNLSVTIKDEKRPIKSIAILVNGHQLGENELASLNGRSLSVQTAGIKVLGDQKTVSIKIPIRLNKEGENRIEITASNGISENRQAVTVIWKPAPQQIKLPNLWILAIGVSKYDNLPEANQLNYCDSDARAIIDVFKSQEGLRYNKVYTRLLADNEPVLPTANNIRNNLKFLIQGEGSVKPTADDYCLLFISGHGINDGKGGFYIIPRDIRYDEGALVTESVIQSGEIFSVLNAPGKRMAFIDACRLGDGHSGIPGGQALDNDKLVRILKESNALVFTSSRSTESSLEIDSLKHGAFAYSVVKNIREGKKGTIMMLELSNNIMKEVQGITNDKQHPRFSALTFDDFPLAEKK